MNANFLNLTVKQLQLELTRRGAFTTGQKQDLIEDNIIIYYISTYSSREESIFLLLHAYRMCGDATHSQTLNVLTLFILATNK